jgi:hypothetical protein
MPSIFTSLHAYSGKYGHECGRNDVLILLMKAFLIFVHINIKNFSNCLFFLFCETATDLCANMADTAWKIFDFEECLLMGYYAVYLL